MDQELEITVYVDLDGVIVNWDKGYMQISGGIPEPEFKAMYGGGASLNLIKKYGAQWWENLEWMPDGKELWRYITNNFLKYKILTATGRPGGWTSIARKGKTLWMEKNLPDLPKSDWIIVGPKEEKKNYARPGDILIDDTPKNVNQWIEAGGVGILHKNAVSTIQKLKDYE